MVTRGFTGRRPPPERAGRIPPGQHETFDFPVLSAGPTPKVDLASWSFLLREGPRPLRRWNWEEFNALPRTTMTVDIHCVTAWSKLGTQWEGVLVDDIFAAAGVIQPDGTLPTEWTLAHTVDGYSANVPTGDLTGGKAMVALLYDGQPLAPDHGGPARLLVPHLYFWKSAKWVNGLQFIPRDTGGFWELRGYHMRGDPWQEQRFTND
ncbi:MAG: molybdopterin-dependent oxidoreductase [Gemmatimonadota bacterium]